MGHRIQQSQQIGYWKFENQIFGHLFIKKLFLSCGNVHNILAFINRDDNTFDAFLMYLPFYHSYNNKQQCMMTLLLGFCTVGNIQTFCRNILPPSSKSKCVNELAN